MMESLTAGSLVSWKILESNSGKAFVILLVLSGGGDFGSGYIPDTQFVSSGR